MSLLFSAYSLGPISLKNRVVMAPMTRNRAHAGVPTPIMATFYSQRAEAGLLVTEGVSPSPNGLGYARIPGIFSQEQANAWKTVTEAVHAKGGKIFVQLMHTGRASHSVNFPSLARVLAPSAMQQDGEIWTDAQGMQPYSVPEEMSEADIEATLEEFASAAALAISAGFDGVELHGANGYLIEQFINPASNQRSDAWGQDRKKFAIEAARRVAARIGADRTGIRLSPYGAFNSMMPSYEGIEEAYEALASELGKLGLAYIHIVDHSSMGAPTVTASVKEKIQKAFGRTLILSGGYDRERAEADLAAHKGDLVAFGRPFISNPRLVTAMREGKTLRAPDFSTFYTPGEKGYTDYPEEN